MNDYCFTASWICGLILQGNIVIILCKLQKLSKNDISKSITGFLKISQSILIHDEVLLKRKVGFMKLAYFIES